MKFAIVNDLHIGPPSVGIEKGVQRKLMAEGSRILENIIFKLNDKEHPDFVVNLGDSIEDVNDKEVDIQSFKKFLSMLSKLKMPTYSLIGNHDVRTLSAKEIAKLLGYKKMYYSFDFKTFHFIALSLDMVGDHTHILKDIAASVPSEQLSWLKTDLKQTDKPTIVFIHYPLAEDNMKGNFWFETESQYALLENRKEVRKILEASKKVKAVFSAHQHWNRFHVHNKIPYFTITSPIENFKNEGVASETYTIVELNNDEIVVKVIGNESAEFSYRF